jgi:hypothetical protein
MKIRGFRPLLALVLVNCLAVSASAKTKSPFQPGNRPLSLSVVASTYLSGTDATSLSFNANLPNFLNVITTNLKETVAYTGAGLNQLDPTRLYFTSAYAPRVYYIYEGACYDNALGVTIANASTPTATPVAGTSYTVFPFGHSSISPVCCTGSGVRSSSEPLMAGDWVQLPTVNAGQQLAFFLMAEMDNNSKPAYVYYDGAANNDDNFPHMIAFFPDNSSQFLIIGFEDMHNGGDKDCNDLMFVVDVGPSNAAALRNASTQPK